MSYNVKTQAYSGPFDLLLQLVSRQKLDIGSISIAEVADQYMREVQSMGELDLDVARVDDEDDDEDDLASLSPDEAREVLIARLIAYKQFRNAAAALGSRMEAESLMEPRTAGPDPEFMGLMPDYLEGITLRSLAVICADLDSRRQGFLLEAEHIAPKRLPIALTVASVDRVTRAHPLVSFSELLDGDLRPETLVATFLAILELEKRGSVVLTQEQTFGEIDVARVEGAKPFELDNSDLTSIEEDA